MASVIGNEVHTTDWLQTTPTNSLCYWGLEAHMQSCPV